VPKGWSAAALAFAVVAGGTGCTADDGRVTLAFEPEEGAEEAYETVIESTTFTDLPGTPAVTETDQTGLRTTQRVLDVSDGGVRVEVALNRPGIGTRTFVVRLDRAAQLTTVEEVEGVPAAALGDLGLSEIFPRPPAPRRTGRSLRASAGSSTTRCCSRRAAPRPTSRGQGDSSSSGSRTARRPPP
jgi:hypothetical protein